MAGLLALASLVHLAPVPPPGKEDAKKALEALQGEWRVTNSGLDDNEFKEVFEKQGKVVIKGTRVTLLVKADVNKEIKFLEVTIKLAPARKPKDIDLKVEYVIPVAGVESTAKGKTIKGIYSLVGNTLKLYTADDDEARPKKFPARGEKGVVTLTRVKPKK
jgi:uncharacterized protein (TIGR03067 family)